MPLIRTRPLVFDDLAEIWSYIAEDSPNRADTFIDSIEIVKELKAGRGVGSRLKVLLERLRLVFVP